MPRPSTRFTRSINNRPPSSPPPPLPPTPEEEAYLANLALLRRNWKWAVFSQFYFTFAQLFAMDDVPISAIEDDLARSARVHTSRVMHRLLYALTQDRKITIDNWQSSLRRQYARRDPTSNPIGVEPKKVNQKYTLEPEDPQQSASTSIEPEQAGSRAMSEDKTQQRPKDEPDDDVPPEADLAPDPDAPELRDWHDLPMLSKLDSMNLLIEWMFYNPYRIRSIMRDDDETAQWRIEPIGYDVRRNAYWLIGADQLWIQRSAYKPKNLKRKRLPALKQPTTKETRLPAGKRRKVLQDDSSDSPGNVSDPSPRGLVTSGPRAAKLKANKKLDAQAKALAEFQRENAIEARSTRQTRRSGSDVYAAPSLSRPSRGTRVSSRLRSAKPDLEEEWQSIPEEWLTEDNSEPLARESAWNTKHNRPSTGDTDLESDPEDPKLIKTGLESEESVSDLTDLSSDREGDLHEDPLSAEESSEDRNKCDNDTAPEEKHDDTKLDDNIEEFIEWEMICSTLSEWEHIPERFEGAAHYSEKALYKLLKNRIVPAVVADLREIERKKQEVERKRLLEEAVTHRKRSSRIAMKESEKEVARLISQRKAEEAEKVSRAKRLEMRQQREEAERERKDREQRRRDHGPRTRANTGGRRHVSRETSTSSTSRVSNDQRSDWELNCEVCLQHMRNQDDGVPIMCCGSCNIWQHISCHEERDRKNGRPPRDWEREEFYCSRCRAGSSTNGRRASRTLPPSTPQQTKVQLQWDHSRSGAKSSGPAQPPYMGVPLDQRDYYQTPPASGMANGGYSYSRPVYNGHSSSLPASVDHQYSNISFSHYQPQQRGFTSRHPQPPTYNSTHYPNSHHLQPTHDISPIYPTYTNGAGNPTMLSYHSQLGFGGRYRTSASTLPLQNGIGTPSNWNFSPSNDPGSSHVPTSPTYEAGHDSRLYGPSHQVVQSQYVPLMDPSHSGTSVTGGPHSM